MERRIQKNVACSFLASLPVFASDCSAGGGPALWEVLPTASEQCLGSFKSATISFFVSEVFYIRRQSLQNFLILFLHWFSICSQHLSQGLLGYNTVASLWESSDCHRWEYSEVNWSFMTLLGNVNKHAVGKLLFTVMGCISWLHLFSPAEASEGLC